MAAELHLSKEVSALNIRIKFQKYGVMKFIGHLDMMRYFQKAIRRAGIDIAYSEGYSPHQIMSFAAPLGVGVTSDGEYFDITVNSSQSSQKSIEALNQVMAEGVFILEYKKLPDTAKTSMSLVAAADYFIYEKPEYTSIFGELQELSEKVQDFYKNSKEILITKQTKKSQRELDLKPLIYEMKAIEDSFSRRGLFLKLSAGSGENIKPELVLESFCQFCGIPYDPLHFQIHRLEVYAKLDEIPVKGEKERESYQKYLNHLKKVWKQEGKRFPEFLPLGALGRDIPDDSQICRLEKTMTE
ncbi:MAG: DUF2344 domain-containing protein [Lachnospiraceae bacterium]|nr:DUF2344 domain-containing protein [Lachnospiraceae bacterium]